jgi:arginine/lysine/ornithine decarboxylase
MVHLYTNTHGESIMHGAIEYCTVTIVKLDFDAYDITLYTGDGVMNDIYTTAELKQYLEDNKVYDQLEFDQFTKLTVSDFNKKYAPIIEPNFYGLAINDQEVITYLDRMFQSILQYEPDFTFAQIKTKFHNVVIYASGIDADGIHELREGVQNILNSKN